METDVAHADYEFEVALMAVGEEECHAAVVTTLFHGTHEIAFD